MILLKENKVQFPKIKQQITDIYNRSNNVGNNGPIKLWKDGGRSPINGYNPFIIRTPNNVIVPRDIKTSDDKTIKCDWPMWAGGQFQEWVNEKVAMYEYQMRPIIDPKYYDQILMKMFNKIVYDSTGLDNTQDVPYSEEQYGAVACGSGSSPSQVVDVIMRHISTAVAQMPEMNKNGSYGSEQFHYTDPDMYKFLGPNNEIFYQVLFSLYNSLRNTSTGIYCTIQIVPDKNSQDQIKIYRMDYINNKMWTATGDMPDSSGIQNYNIGPAGNRVTTAVPHSITGNGDGVIDNIPWLYANTLLDQKFNSYGFYDPESNVKLKQIGIPNELQKRIQNVQKFSDTYLFSPATVKYNGTIQTMSDKGPVYSSVKNNGLPKTVMSNPTIIYNPELNLESTKQGVLSPNFSGVQKPNIVGFINT